MAITSFSIRFPPVVELAEVSDVPPVMLIAGANGTGKSRLLAFLKEGGDVQFDTNTHLYYYLPYRGIPAVPVTLQGLPTHTSSGGFLQGAFTGSQALKELERSVERPTAEELRRRLAARRPIHPRVPPAVALAEERNTR